MIFFVRSFFPFLSSCFSKIFCQPRFLPLHTSKALFLPHFDIDFDHTLTLTLTTLKVLLCKCIFADMQLHLIAGDSQTVSLLRVCQRDGHYLRKLCSRAAICRVLCAVAPEMKRAFAYPLHLVELVSGSPLPVLATSSQHPTFDHLLCFHCAETVCALCVGLRYRHCFLWQP